VLYLRQICAKKSVSNLREKTNDTIMGCLVRGAALFVSRRFLVDFPADFRRFSRRFSQIFPQITQITRLVHLRVFVGVCVEICGNLRENLRENLRKSAGKPAGKHCHARIVQAFAGIVKDLRTPTPALLSPNSDSIISERAGRGFYTRVRPIGGYCQFLFYQKFKEMKKVKFLYPAGSAAFPSCIRFFMAGLFIMLFGVASLDAQVKLWGLASDGASGFGSVYSLDADGSDFSAYALPGIAGQSPVYATPLKAANGKFYGVTNDGGIDGGGVLFEYDPAGAGTYKVLHYFQYQSGYYGIGSLLESGGKLYGMTLNGGDFDSGVIFEYDPAGAGTYTVLHHFESATGNGPIGSLLESGGKLYGVTFTGGTGGVGVFFEYDLSSDAYTVLHDFQYGNGSFGIGKPVEKDGKFYGMTYGGGVSDVGVIYELDPANNNNYTVLHNFEDATGTSPYGSLIESGGKFYGMTQFGGTNLGGGVLFEFDPAGSGTYNALYSFEYATGSNPLGTLLESGGKFYGVAPFGGSFENGAMFEYDPAGSGTYTVLHDFDSNTGSNPQGGLIESDGKFYGLTNSGGLSGGVFFEYDPAGSGTYTVKFAFTDAPIGNDPRGRLIKSGDKFYGTARDGGTYDDGVIFEYDPAGAGTYTVLHHFEDENGVSPYGGLIESGGKFYGTTRFGGDDDNGTVFVYDPSTSTQAVLHSFDDANGSEPVSKLIEVGGKLYGTGNRGGEYNEGVIFEYDPAGSGTYTVLHQFDFTNGSGPYGGLVEMGGKFYGTALYGGNDNSGVLYEYDPSGSGTYTVLHHFSYWTDGGEPQGTLIASGGKLYGTASRGGSNDAGTIFEFDPSGSGTFTTLHHFEAATGSAPEAGLAESGGKFYGTATEGGDYNGGVIFEYDPAGPTYTVIRHLSNQDGVNSICQLLVVDETPVTNVSGKLIWENDDATGVGNATVTMSGEQSGSLTTTAAGTYSFTPASGSDITITPTKTTNKLNGLSTADVTRIQRHVANIEPLTDPYKMVAADVNKTNSVTSQDASIINQALLGSPTALNQIKTSWRFIPVSHTLSLPPWGFPENLSLTNVSGNMTNRDFYGIKTGDVASPFTNPANLQDGGNFVVLAQDQALEAGSQVTVAFGAAQFDDLAALQFALRFDADKLMLADVTPLGGLPLSTEHFGTYEISEGLLKMAWAQAEGTVVEEAAPLFSLTFNVLSAGGLLSEALQLDDTALESHAYTSDLSDNKVELAFSSTTDAVSPVGQPRLALLQNRPNPFTGSTTIGFVLPEACEAQLRVYDASGRVLFAQQKYYPAGKHEELFESVGASGVLWYELTTPSGVLTRKMMVVER
jgi:uncharacterized repeat protein (TIGR03803 family)